MSNCFASKHLTFMIFSRAVLRFMSNKNVVKPVNFEKYNNSSYETPIFSSKQVDLSNDESKALREASAVLEAGGCIAAPTDTVYGLITRFKFLPKLFAVKKRLPTKPVALFIRDSSVIKQYAEQTVDDELLNRLLPGRCTLLFRRIPHMTNNFRFNTDLVGFRIPDDEFIQKLCQQFDEPLAQTSANLSGMPSALQPEEFSAIWETLDLIVVNSKRKLEETRDGSTIIDLSEPGTYSIKRDGCALDYYERTLHDSNLTKR